jgi:glycosyltransferase involved in cell wall biosynthesis
VCVVPRAERAAVGTLVAAVGLLAGDRPGLEALVVGAADLAPEVDAHVARLGLADRVRLLDALPEDGVGALLAAGAVLLRPCSRHAADLRSTAVLAEVLGCHPADPAVAPPTGSDGARIYVDCTSHVGLALAVGPLLGAPPQPGS